MDQESTGGTVDTYGDGVSFYVGAEALDADSCPGTNAYSWSYEVTWGACADTHVRPTSTPLPTVTPTVTPWYTRPCPTSAAPNVGWWMW